MNPTVVKVAKTAVGVLSVVVPIASEYFGKQDMKKLVAKEVAKALKDQARRS